MISKWFFPLFTVLLLLLLQLASAGEGTAERDESTSTAAGQAVPKEVDVTRGTERRSKTNERSPLQKWLNAEWSQKHEVPFHWFMQQHHYMHNTSRGEISEETQRRLRRGFPAAHMTVLSEATGRSLSSDAGRYIIVRLDKLSREERRKARHALIMNSKRDAHIIDDLHMLVYVDTPHAARVLSAIEADESATLAFLSMTVLDIYSTPPGAQLKLSRVLRVAISRCKGFTDTPGVVNDAHVDISGSSSSSSGRNSGGNGSMASSDLNREGQGQRRRRLVLDVSTAPGRENAVEESLRGVQSDKSPSVAKTDVLEGCQWFIVSAVNGKGLVRWILTLSPETPKDTDDVICRCVSFIGAATRHPAVRWVEIAFEQATPVNDHATAIVQRGEQKEARPLRPLWDVGIDGTGEVIGIADSGIDYDSCFFNDEKEAVSIYPKINRRHRKILSFAPSNLFPGVCLIGDKVGGHGTHVAGTAAGRVVGKGVNSKYDGVARGAKIFFMSLGSLASDMLDLPIDILDVFRPAYDAGARVFSNSWGLYAPPEYTLLEKKIDDYLNTRDDALLVFASGNEPSAGLLTPCRSKNTLCIGAHMNTFDTTRQNDIASFSAFGPTYDGRQKPDIVAPGEWITSATSDGNVTTMQCTVDSKKGTSMATAAAAGTLTLIRHHLRKIEKIASPSVSLLKALAIHSSVYLGETHNSGFGRIDLSVFFTPTGVKGWFRDRDSVNHRETKKYCFTVGDKATDEHEAVRITLVWIDAGSAMEGSTRSIVNDLDVVVVDSAGVIHYAGENGLANTNVIEQIRLQPSKELSAGFSVIVYGSNVHDGTLQSYALVVSGPGLNYLANCDTLSSAACANGCSGNGRCIGGACKCFAGYRFVDCSLCDEESLCHGRGTCSATDLKCKCDNDNFADDSCSRCKEGWYGPSCSSNCTCSGRGKCDRKTGECTCLQDTTYGGKGCFSGPNCEYCCRDFDGDNCTQRSYWCREDGIPLYVNDSAGGYIQINGYGRYPQMLICRWVIVSPRSRKVKLEYLKFNVEEPKDAVFLFDVDSEEGQPLRVDSGTVANGTVVVSTTNVLSIFFSSQWSHVREGFLFRYSFVKPVDSNCTTPCVENALCNMWNGGFCVCDLGWADWGCTTEVAEKATRTKLLADSPRGAEKLNFLINDEIPLTLQNLSTKDYEVFLFMAFPHDFLTNFVSRGMALRATIFSPLAAEGFRQKRQEMMMINDTCKYAKIGLGRVDRDALNVTLSVLQNVSLNSAVHGKIKFDAKLYALKNTSSRKQKEGDESDESDEGDEGGEEVGNTLLLSCSSEEPVGFSPKDSNKTKDDEKESHLIRFGYTSLFIVSVFLCVGIVVNIFLLLRFVRRRERYAMGAIPSEEVVVEEGTLEPDDESDILSPPIDNTTAAAARNGDSIINHNNDVDNGVELIPISATEAQVVAQETVEPGALPMGRRRGRRNIGNSLHIPLDEDDSETEMVEKK